MAAASSFGILALLVAIACAVNLSTPDVMMEERQMFRDYVHFYHKNYTHAEYELRFLNFQESLRRINQLNQKYTKTKFGINQFSDMSVNEFRRSRLMSEKITGEALARSCLSNGVTASDIDTNAIPTSFDWRDKGVVTPVKDQGQCGSCWAFSTIGNIESQFAIHKKGPLTQFSEQMLVDCSQGCSNEPPYGPVCNQGCNGGWQWNAFFDVISWGGIETETDYPYSGVDGTCNYSVKKLHAPLKNYTCLTTNASVGVDETKMAAFLVQNGPLSIALDAELLMDYSSGIIEPQPGDCSGEQLDHALLLVGYGVDSMKTPYWIIKNSWASTWGESGYFRIIRGQSACGLNNAVSSAILK